MDPRGAAPSATVTGLEVFRRAIGAVEASRIPYMLTGSLASAYWAVPRATQDIDLVIAPARHQLAALERAFAAPAYHLDRITVASA